MPSCMQDCRKVAVASTEKCLDRQTLETAFSLFGTSQIIPSWTPNEENRPTN